jgi:hypothetical protein
MYLEIIRRLRMPIKDRNLKPGARLEARYHKQAYTCEVVAGEGGKLRYRLEDGREFKSPSAAGMAISGHACDGWVFWSVKTTEGTPTTSEAPVTETSEPETWPPAEAPVTSKSRSIFRAPNQKGVPAGQTRWFCRDCGESFLAPIGELPRTCPQGHKAI